MTSPNQKVYVFGRLRGVTTRRIGQLARSSGLVLIRRPSTADIIVLAQSTARKAVSEQGELRLRFRPRGGAQLLSERSFRSLIGLAAPKAAAEGRYSEDQVAKLAGLGVEQLRTFRAL